MKYAYRFFLFLCVLSCFCFVVGAVDAFSNDSIVPDLEPTVPKVALDVVASDVEPSVPMVEISPDSISALASAISDSFAYETDSSYILENDEHLKNGYYFTCDCAIQDNLTIYVPVEFAVNAFSLDSEGQLVNMTLNTFESRIRIGKYIYVIKAPSMSTFKYYKETVNGSYDPMEVYDLFEHVTDSNMSFLKNTPQVIPSQNVLILLVVLLILGILAVCFLARR